MYLLRVYFCAFLAIIVFLAFGLWAVLLLPLPKERWRLYVGRPWIASTLWLCRFILKIDYKLEGAENLPKDRPFILACQHQSAFETLVMELLFDAPGYVTKKEALSIPIFGRAFRRLPIAAVDRSAGASALKTLTRDAKAIIQQGATPIVIFPEGTRQRVGTKINFHIGFAVLYKELKIPVVPMAIDAGHYWGAKFKDFRPGTVRLRALPAIEPGLSARAVKERAETMVEDAQKL